MEEPTRVTFRRDFFDKIQDELQKQGELTDKQIHRFVRSIRELDFKCEELAVMLRHEIVPAILERDELRLFHFLILYELKLWEIQGFRYLRDARGSINTIVKKLDAKLEDDEVDEYSQYLNSINPPWEGLAIPKTTSARSASRSHRSKKSKRTGTD